MDFEPRYSEEQQQFRQEVKNWLEENVPKDLANPADSKNTSYEEYQKYRELGRRLGEKGWLWPTAPVEYGGGGLSIDSAIVIEEEMDSYEMSLPPYYDSGGRLGGASILVWGSEEQKQHFMPPIIKGEVRTWQLLTEPGAGSDLAGVKISAVRDGDEYVINGQKIFVGSSNGAEQYWMLTCTDQDGTRHQNLSWFIIPSDTPGITVTPMDLLISGGEGGAGTGVKNTIFFDNVRVPKKDMLGELNRGWYVALTTLAFERSGIVNAVALQQLLEEIVEATRPYRRAGDVHARNELADRAIETQVAIMLSHRVASVQAKGQMPIQEASITKLFCSELGQRIARTSIGLAGLYGQLGPESSWAPLMGRIERTYLIQVGATLAGGTSEIQRNIIATRGLGLPRN